MSSRFRPTSAPDSRTSARSLRRIPMVLQLIWTPERLPNRQRGFIESTSCREACVIDFIMNNNILTLTLLAAVAVQCSVTVATAAIMTNRPAPDIAPPMPAHMIDSLDGPVATNELAVFGRVALAYPLPTHNFHNNLVYGRSHEADDLL